MRLKQKIYEIWGVLMTLFFLLPTVVVSTHMFLHHRNENTHYHKVVTYCNEEIHFCNYNIVQLQTPAFIPVFYYKTPILFEIKRKVIDTYNIYVDNLIFLLKGRAPPCYFLVK